jgi:tRNA-Thr(GGU) m(6)t(6)A37 methyltransferase TsaA
LQRVEKVDLKPIGYVRRASKQEDVKDRTLASQTVIHKKYAKALEGLEDFSHLFVIFYMHKVRSEETERLKVHPRGRLDLPLVGVFATRSAFRPNPIGLTVVELLERRGNVLVVRGLDAFDGTPVLDLKPADDRDMVARLRVPKWLKMLHSAS